MVAWESGKERGVGGVTKEQTTDPGAQKKRAAGVLPCPLFFGRAAYSI